MICEECGKKPSMVHLTKIINGEKNELHLCEDCAKDMGEFIPGALNHLSINHLFSGLLNFEPQATTKSHHPNVIRCEHCGLTYNQFSKIGRFGCGHCYKSFSERLEPLLKRVHGNVYHVGKVPKRTGGVLSVKREVELLKQEMINYIQQEEFEQAAKIRDQIRELEKKISNSNF
jgi:protein arginine kinase activator